MQRSVRKFVKLCSEALPILEPIYEFGSLQIEGQEKIADLRPFFPNKAYVGIDIREGQGVDEIGDIQNTHYKDESMGTILMLDTLEHVQNPMKAINEAFRMLKPKGILIISSVMNCPIHSYPQDYWRFTPECVRMLLESFESSFVDYTGDSMFPYGLVGIGIKDKYDVKIETSWKDDGWRGYVNVMIPPIVWKLLGTYLIKAKGK